MTRRVYSFPGPFIKALIGMKSLIVHLALALSLMNGRPQFDD